MLFINTLYLILLILMFIEYNGCEISKEIEKQVESVFVCS